MRVLALFQERESRDELGLGAIRDSFSDALFPGTSTLQTRIRYMLFVPWVYRALEEKRISPPEFAAKARQSELALIDPLLANSDHDGVFGRIASKTLQRLPSSVYWYGLETWGIRKIKCSQYQYHRYVDQVYNARDVSRHRIEKDGNPESETQTWHPRLPDPPVGFPHDIGFELEPEEAKFLQDRLVQSQKDSLLTHLALHCQPVHCTFIWEHPELNNFPAEPAKLVRYAEFFSTLMQGGAYLYNMMLAELAKLEELKNEHQKNLKEWQERILNIPSSNQSLDDLWVLTTGRGHNITKRTKDFVSLWHQRVAATGGDVGNDSECRKLIETRERLLKGVRSRFTNPRARDQWTGYAGVSRMTYRWGKRQNTACGPVYGPTRELRCLVPMPEAYTPKP